MTTDIIFILILVFVIVINFEVNHVRLEVEEILDNQKEILQIIKYDSNMVRSHIMNAGAEKPIDE